MNPESKQFLGQPETAELNELSDVHINPKDNLAAHHDNSESRDEVEDIYVKPKEVPTRNHLQTGETFKQFLHTGHSAYEGELSYIPFDPVVELEDLRTFSSNNQDLGGSEKLEIKKKKLIEYKEALMHQKEGVKNTIQELYQAIEKSPGMSTDDLMKIVLSAAPEYRFSRIQLYNFETVLKKYHANHADLEKYTAQYEDPADLFEACFDQRPEERVEVVKGPMTLCFQCFSRNDYATAFGFGEERDAKGDIPIQVYRSAQNTFGAALPRVKIAELAGMVIAENVSENNPRFEEVHDHEVIRQLDEGKDRKFYFMDQNKDVLIETGTGALLELQLKVNEDGNTERVFLVDLLAEDPTPLLDANLQHDYDKGSVFIRNDQGDIGENGRRITVVTEEMKIEFSTFGFRVINTSSGKIKVHSVEDQVIMIANDAESKKVIKHEDQHQFNRLFAPFENEYSALIEERNQRILSRDADPKQMLQTLIRGRVKFQRSDVDSRARDEILAQYAGGTKSEKLFKEMTTSPHYDYIGDLSEMVNLLTPRLIPGIKSEISGAFYRVVDGKEVSVEADDLNIESLIKEGVADVFGEGYRADLKRWTDSISILEEKGYSRDDIVALVHAEPVKDWPRLAHRIKRKSELEVVG